MEKIKLGFSTCPNDTFIFDALVHHRIDTQGLDFEVIMGDIEELNTLASLQKLDITKISFNAYGQLSKDYILCDSGSALGKNNGPLLIAKENHTIDNLVDKIIAIPGKQTTANLLLSIVFPQLKNKQPYLFSDIEQAILNDKVTAGLIIHETRFTYMRQGLTKIVDLGDRWEKTWQKPLPLGGICAKRSLPREVLKTVNRLLHESVAFAFANKEASLPFIKQYAQTMSEEVMYNHIDLYVNAFTQDLGKTGKDAIRFLYQKAGEYDLLPHITEPLFVSEL